MVRFQFTICVAAFLAVHAIGCSDDEAGCGDGPACAIGQACVDGECRVVCVGDGDCAGGMFCDEGVCWAAECGNGVVEADETCDAGVANADSTGCTSFCQLARCGDGLLYVGVEECDDGNDDNTDACPDGDDGSCVPSFCGDGFVRAGDEACDDGNRVNEDACLNDCRVATCGDGVVRAGEEDCDNGAANDNEAACKADCSEQECGDGFVGPGEGCDDGNDVDDDLCSNQCVPENCGNQEIDAGEDCDDGNDSNEDACLNTCVDARCGDGFAWDGNEDCDDGNGSLTDACPDGPKGSCAAAFCGDGFVLQDVETCDDGPGQGEGLCLDDCTAVQICGDGLLHGAEACDDGNTTAGDGCDGSCTAVESNWSCDGGEPSRCVHDSMVVVEAGTFLMGSPDGEVGRDADELQHEVTLTRDFAMKITQVTQGEWVAVVGWNTGYAGSCGMTCPAGLVNWLDAAAYANQLSIDRGFPPCYAFAGVVCEDATSVDTDWAQCMNPTALGIDRAVVTLTTSSVYDCVGYRLPTEAEWEYAARAGTTEATYNGDLESGFTECQSGNTTLDPIAWHCGNSGEAQPVGGKAANDLGLLDMLGNVYDWVNDSYVAYPTEPVIDPEGPIASADIVLRGGSFSHDARCSRAAWRITRDAGYRSNIGFRVARTLHD